MAIFLGAMPFQTIGLGFMLVLLVLMMITNGSSDNVSAGSGSVGSIVEHLRRA